MKTFLFILGQTAILFLPIWGLIRAVGAVFSERSRRRVAAHPILHAAWFCLSICFVVVVLDPGIIGRRLPPFYHRASGGIYWQTIVHGNGGEIAHRNGIIFFYMRGHHGASFHSISEVDAARTRTAELRTLTDQILFTYDGRQNDPLARAELLTLHSAPTVEAFAEWWRQVREDFEFDAEADVRYRENLAKRSEGFRKYVEEFERLERERFERGEYRTDS